MINGNVNSCASCVHGWESFHLLTPEELEKVNNSRYEAIYQSGEIVFKEGTPASDAVFISSGLAKISVNGFGNKNLLLTIVGSKRLILGPGAYVDNRHHYTLTALTELRVCFISTQIFKELVQSNPIFADSVIRDVSVKSLSMHYRMVSLIYHKMHGRLAEGLLFLADEIFKSNRIRNILTRQDMGDFTGMTKESVVRILKEFEKDKIVALDPSYIEILDKDRLTKIMQTG